jgi:hypothetical protein
MTRVKIVGVAAILSIMIAAPVFAQAAIQEPGALTHSIIPTQMF